VEKPNEKTAQIEKALEFALEKNEFIINYQPVFDLHKKKWASVEALLNWKHTSLGQIQPDIFIPLAEKNDLIIPIGYWVLKTVCQQIAKWGPTIQHDFKLLVNVSPSQLRNDLFVFLTDLLEITKIPAHSLELEITESAMITDAQESNTTINKIKKMGIRLAIDDFGTGFSCFSRLRNFPIDSLKIDKSFIHEVTTNPSDAIIVRTMIRLGKELGLNVIAEGVENEEQFQFLIDNDCPQAQGFYLCEPKNGEDITEFFRKI